MIRKFVSLLMALMLSLLSTSAVFAASYPSPPSVVEDAASSNAANISPIGVVRQDSNDTALTSASGDNAQLTCNDMGNLKVQVEASRKQTYTFSTAPFAVANSPTLIFEQTGSGTKTIKIYKVTMTYTATGTGGIGTVLLNKYTTASTSGTSSAITASLMDSQNNAVTSTAKSFTANPTLGTLAYQITGMQLHAIIPSNANGTQIAPVTLFEAGPQIQPITLRGAAQCFGIHGNSSTWAGTTPTAMITTYFTEE